MRGYSLTANGKVFFSEGSLQPYAALGLGAINGEVKDPLGVGLDTDDTDALERVALGLDHHDAERFWWFCELAYGRPLNELEDISTLALTIGFGLGLGKE